MEHRIRRKNV